MTHLAPDERRRLYEHRLDRLRALIAAHQAGAIVLQHRRDFAWLTVGGQNHVLLSSERGAAPLLVEADDAVVLAPVNESARIAAEETSGLPIEVEALPWWDAAAADTLARRLAHDRPVLAASDLADELGALRSVLASPEHERLAVAVRAVIVDRPNVAG